MVLARLLIAAAASLALAGPLAAQAAPRTVTVLGEARLAAAPDQAFITAGVSTQGKVARDALSANSRAVAEVLRVLQEAGVAATDIHTVGVSVQPLIAFPKDGNGAPRVTGYSVSNQVAVQLADPARLGEMLDKLVTAGANQISEVRLGFADEAKLRDAVRAEAVAEARRKAEIFAVAAGARLGRVLQVSEVDDAAPRPARALRAGTTEAVPIAPGTQSLAVQVSVSWELDN